MHQVARIFGYINMISGIVMLFAPGAAREIVHARAGILRSFAEWQLEFGQLSHGALRVLGAWSLVMGAIVVWVTSAKEEASREKAVPPEFRRAA